MADTKELTVSCSCGAAKHTLVVPTSSLPLSTTLCNSHTSRHISGTLLTSYFNITHGTNPEKPDVSPLTSYESSETLRRWFCANCGTHMYVESRTDGHFEAATGTLVCESSDGILEWTGCTGIEDTLDGGASDFLTHINGKKLKRYAQEPLQTTTELAPDWRQSPTHQPSKPRREDKNPVHAYCHCRGVEFWITCPDERSTSAKSPWPDLVVPYYTHNEANPTNHPWWLPSPTKYLAGTCACHACRRASGFDTTFWAFIPTTNIFLDADLTQLFPADERLENRVWGSMRTYASSTGVARMFCARCGANVFWNGSKETHGRVDLIDVAVGLLDADSGARAEDVLAWWSQRVSFEEFALNRGLADGLARGIAEWAERNGDAASLARF